MWAQRDTINQTEMKAPKIKGGNKTAFYNSKLLKEAELRTGKPILQLKPFNIFGVFKDMRSL